MSAVPIQVSSLQSSRRIPGLSGEQTAQIRERELRAAADTLGLADVRFLGWHDGRLAEADETVVIGQLTAVLRELQPQAVFTFGPEGISGLPDHVAIHHLTVTAFEQANKDSALFYIAPSEATRQGCGIPPVASIAGGPVVGIDVGAYRVTKVRAAQCHTSQNPPFTGPPEQEAEHLACHEYFVLALPLVEAVSAHDLFDPKLFKEVCHE